MMFLISNIYLLVNFQTSPLRDFVNLFIHHPFMESLLYARYYFQHWLSTVNKTQAIVSTVTLVRMKEANGIALLHAQQ